jgi:hypothetical protein
MTLFVPQWATNLNYSAGPDAGTPTKVDPSSIPNGFVQGVIAAPQHVNFLIAGLSEEIVKAIDGVDGGTYTLGDPLIFDGDDVQFAATARVLSGGLFTVNSGGSVVLSSGATVTLNAALDINGNADLDAAAVFTVHGEIALATSGGGELSVASGAIINVNSGGRVDLNTGSELNVEGTAHIDVEGTVEVLSTGNVNVNSGGNVNLKSGGELIVESGGFIISQAGGTIRVEDGEDLVINDAAEGFRSTLTPAFHDVAGQWEKNNAGGTLAWKQTDVSAARSIWFALPVNPGDTIVNVYARVEAEDHPGGMPGFVDMPVLELISVDLDGVVTSIATKVDNPATEPDYDALHDIVLEAGTTDTGAMPHVASADPVYIRLGGEKGASAVTGLTLRSISGNIIARSYRAANMVY